jgi:hypothetical protein
MKKLQQLALRQAKEEIEAAERVMYSNSKTFPGLATSDTPENQLMCKLGRAKAWIESMESNE